MTDEQRSQPPRPAARPTGIFLKHALKNITVKLKGFPGGVPQNTETAAVNPRVGNQKVGKR